MSNTPNLKTKLRMGQSAPHPRALEWRPLPESELKRRLGEALELVHNPRLSRAEVGAENFFDFECGLRLVISRVRAPNSVIFTQISAGVNMDAVNRYKHDHPITWADSFLAEEVKRLVSEWFEGYAVVKEVPGKEATHILLRPVPKPVECDPRAIMTEIPISQAVTC